MIAQDELVFAEVSLKEEALRLVESLADGTPVNNQSVTFTVAGHLDPDRLQAALSVVLRRHDALRTVYRGDSRRTGKRVLDSDEFELGVTRIGLAGAPAEEDLAPVLNAPFALDGAPMLRVALFQGPDTDVFCLTAHHLIFDPLSASVFVAELAAAYGGEALEPAAAGFEPLPSAESLAYWRATLAGAHDDDAELLCAAPETGPRTPAATHISRELPAPVVAAVRGLGDELRVPPSAILLAAYHLLLEAHGAGSDLIVGSPVDTRPDSGARAIGYHVNYVPLRLTIDRRERVRDLVLRSAETLRGAEAHADVPVDAHADLLPRSRPGRRITPFRYVFQPPTGHDLAEFRIGDLAATPLALERGFSKFDIDLSAAATGDTVQVRVQYRSELLEPADATLLVARYEAVLAALAADADAPVGDIPVWSAHDREVIAAANDTAGPVQPVSVLRGIQERVLETPGLVAVVQGDQPVTYGQLWNSANELAGLLRASGVEPGDVVAVALPRGADLIVSVLGAWLAGAAYLPIDAAHPEERIRYQLADSGARVLLAGPEMAYVADDQRVLLTPPGPRDGELADPGPVAVDPAACAYLIYTSGSTGRPKGTRISHAALANLIAHFVDELTAAPGDTMLWLTTFAFDISGLELFVPLVSGGRLVPAPDSARSDGRVLRDLVERHDVRFVQATPTTWRLVLDRVESGLRGRTVLAGGEIVPAWLAQRLGAAGAEFHHVYGPTETTVWSTSRVVTDASPARLDVGRPIRNTQVFVVDRHGRDLPIGVRGELCIAGDGVAIGYHERPDLNAQRFGEHPVYGRFYRTGDVARWRADGVLDLFGRSDRQVKLRGNRIELGEIEATLLAHPDVDAAAVVMIGDPSADAVLVGCLEPTGDSLDIESVWTHARAHLSRSMLPGDLLAVDAMPINGSGKVDYPALERFVADRRARTASARLELDRPDLDDELTSRLTALWGTILQRVGLTADSNFFESGGNSMLAAWAMQELQNMTGVSLGLGEIFERPTPQGLATRVRDAVLEEPATR
jgi:amino acid adenylation domain-containing protein